MLTSEDRDAIRLLIVATESSPDQEKPASSWVHHFLWLRSDCRNFEVKHACYGATGALQIAIGWLTSIGDPRAKALIVNADHALIGLRGPQEPVLGLQCEGGRYDVGHKLDFLRAIIELALDREDLGPPLAEWMRELVRRRGIV